MIQKLEPAQLRRTVDPESLGIESTADLPPEPGIIGQKRAVAALRFGLNIPDHGFNVYVSGPPGIGKMTAVHAFLEEIARSRRTALDWCYVNNFEDPYRPKVCRLPAGQGRQLQRDMDELVEHLRREIPKVFESEDYSTRRDEIVGRVERARGEVFERLRQKALAAGFTLETTPIGMVILPVRNGRPLQEEEFQALPDEAKRELEQRREALEGDLKSSLREVRSLTREAKEDVRNLRARVALFLVGGLIDDLVEKYRGQADVTNYLRAVQTDIVEQIDTFRTEPQLPEEMAGLGTVLAQRFRDLAFRRYRVNVLVDNGRVEGAPVVVDLNPSYPNLVGRIEREAELGAVTTDFTMIRAGSLHRANGGFLVLPIEETLRYPYCWDSLKNALRARVIEIEDLADRLGLSTTRSLKPEPVPLEVKVVLVGQSIYALLLRAFDESFPELFKVQADFDTRMDRARPEVEDFLRFLGGLCRREEICHLDKAAVAKVLEHASRLAEDQEKLSTHLSSIADLVREAHFWATSDGSAAIGLAHVRRALEEKIYRSAMIIDRVREMIDRGFLLVETTGEVVGQVNGLSVFAFGGMAFGRPSRITATVGPGRGAVVDIEREVELGGRIHSKGVLILGGFLAQRFASERPLTISARLVFEQSYEGVEGDSASSTELYALLSALSGIPIRQGIAVTGSVNQRGEVQAIGGANEKVEGFYDVCRLKGLTGDQGVILPRSNAATLMLREDVVEAVAQERFHIWTVDTVDEGIEILTGTPAGAVGPDGGPKGTVNARVAATLERYAERLRELGPPVVAPAGNAGDAVSRPRAGSGRGRRRSG